MPSSHLFLWCPLLLLPSIFPSIRDFSNESSVHIRSKILELQVQHQSFQREFRIDFPSDWLVWSPCWLRDFQESSPAPQLEGITALVLHLLHGPALTTVHGHWEDHSLDYMDLCQQSNVSAFQHTVQEYYSVIKRKEVLMPATTYTKLKNIRLNERSQIKKTHIV